MATAPQLRRANILVVDDKYPNMLALEAVLGRDHNVLFANSGREAIDMVRGRTDIDVVLMDVQMPVMDGFETARLIKQLPGNEELPIIFVSAVYFEDPYIKQGYQVGGLDYFTKPFDPELLKLKVGIYASYRLRGELLRADHRAVQTEELLRLGREVSTQLEQVPAGVLIADSAGRICQMTDEAGRVLKATESTRRDIYGQLLDWWSGAGKSFKSADGPLDRALAHAQSTHNAHLEVCCVDGTMKSILASAMPLHAADGEVIGAVILIRDLTAAGQIDADTEAEAARVLTQGVDRAAHH